MRTPDPNLRPRDTRAYLQLICMRDEELVNWVQAKPKRACNLQMKMIRTLEGLQKQASPEQFWVEILTYRIVLSTLQQAILEVIDLIGEKALAEVRKRHGDDLAA